METKAYRKGDALVVEIEGVIDAEGAPEFKSKMKVAVEKAGKRFILNIEKVEFVDSAGLGALLSLSRQCAERNVAFTIVHPQPQIRKLFEITRLYKAIDMFKTY